MSLGSLLLMVFPSSKRYALDLGVVLVEVLGLGYFPRLRGCLPKVGRLAPATNVELVLIVLVYQIC